MRDIISSEPFVWKICREINVSGSVARVARGGWGGRGGAGGGEVGDTFFTYIPSFTQHIP